MTTLVYLPAALRIRADSWAQSDPRVVQRGEFGGPDRELVTGPIARWTCTAEIVTCNAEEILSVRAFLGAMAQRGARALVTFEAAQQAGYAGAPFTQGAADGAGQLGNTLALRSLKPSVLHLRAGQMITWGSDDGFPEMAMLLADLVADGAGKAVAQLASPILRSPVNGTTVFFTAPFIFARLANPLAFRRLPGGLHELPDLVFEQVFF